MVEKIVATSKNAFAEPGHEVGTTKLLEFEVDLKGSAKPVSSRVPPLNPNQRKDLRNQLDQWLTREL